jgi:hypothetical protein
MLMASFFSLRSVAASENTENVKGEPGQRQAAGRNSTHRWPLFPLLPLLIAPAVAREPKLLLIAPASKRAHQKTRLELHDVHEEIDLVNRTLSASEAATRALYSAAFAASSLRCFCRPSVEEGT